MQENISALLESFGEREKKNMMMMKKKKERKKKYNNKKRNENNRDRVKDREKYVFLSFSSRTTGQGYKSSGLG
jgi:hypothetical protein